MKKLLPIIFFSSCLVISASAQNGPRAMDNFDRAQGVQVHHPPAPPVAKLTKKVKKGRGSKWEVVVEEKLVKKTVKSSPVASVTDGLATREAPLPIGRNTLSMGTSTHLKGFTTGNLLHDSYIVDSSRRYGIDPLLIYAQMHQESSFKLNATSHKGASGLMQLMPATARRFGVTSIYDPRQNIDAGVKYMRWLLDTFNGDVVLALAGYNAGEGAVMKYGYNIPPYRETQEYVRRISSRYYSISDPRYVQSARRISSSVATKMGQKVSRPLTIYEPDPIAIKLPNGQMMLYSQ